jgi:hypothetical protein
MIKVIPAHLENGHVVPDVPLPEESDIKSVRLLVELSGTEANPRGGSIVDRLHGLLKDEPDIEGQYREYLERKYR